MSFLKKILNSKKGKKISTTLNTVKKEAVEVVDKVEDKIENYLDEKISFDTFLKTEIKIGEIVAAEKIEKSEKLLKLTVDFDEEKPRQIISGIAKSYSPQEIIGKKTIFVTNLAPRKIFGLESNGMILGVSTGKENGFSMLTPEKKEITVGTRAG